MLPLCASNSSQATSWGINSFKIHWKSEGLPLWRTHKVISENILPKMAFCQQIGSSKYGTGSREDHWAKGFRLRAWRCLSLNCLCQIWRGEALTREINVSKLQVPEAKGFKSIFNVLEAFWFEWLVDCAEWVLVFENDAENGCERGWNCLRNVFSFIRIIKNLIKFQILSRIL